MANNFFRFKEFTVHQGKASFKVGTDGVLLGAAADLEGVETVLDVGTGTGLIALMCAQRSQASITAIEPDKPSYEQAVENARDSNRADRIRLINTDLKSFSETAPERFDTVISNPPYFRNSLLNTDPVKASARHTFSLSSTELLKASTVLLKTGGSLQLILPYAEAALFMAEAGDYGLYCSSLIKIRPNPEAKIIRMIMKFERTRKTVHEKFLSIETGDRHSYTEDYRNLTKDFYLDF
jgi:tRNA1Val (adenine37-N6)-methyltransferase